MPSEIAESSWRIAEDTIRSKFSERELIDSLQELAWRIDSENVAGGKIRGL